MTRPHDPREAVITETQTQYTGKFIRQLALLWRDVHGKERLWECSARLNDRGAVGILATLMPSKRMVVIEQFRPPARGICWEFPAGLIDDGESIEQAAVRELQEECGYFGRIVRVSPPVCSSPGITSERIALVEMVVDETAPENAHPQTNFDPSECILTHLVALDELKNFLDEKLASGESVDSKLYMRALTYTPQA